MTSEQKSDFWQRHIDACRHSQLTQRGYCAQNNLSFSNFGYWRTRLKRKACKGSKFIPVTLSTTAMSVSVYLPGGIRLEVPAHVLPELLPAVCRLMQEQA